MTDLVNIPKHDNTKLKHQQDDKSSHVTITTPSSHSVPAKILENSNGRIFPFEIKPPPLTIVTNDTSTSNDSATTSNHTPLSQQQQQQQPPPLLSQSTPETSPKKEPFCFGTDHEANIPVSPISTANTNEPLKTPPLSPKNSDISGTSITNATDNNNNNTTAAASTTTTTAFTTPSSPIKSDSPASKIRRISPSNPTGTQEDGVLNNRTPGDIRSGSDERKKKGLFINYN